MVFGQRGAALRFKNSGINRFGKKCRAGWVPLGDLILARSSPLKEQRCTLACDFLISRLPVAGQENCPCFGSADSL